MRTDIRPLQGALRTALPELQLTEDAPLSACTTLRLGGPADLLAEPSDEASLGRLLREAASFGVPVTVIGRGSNLLVRDGGIRGLVIRVASAMRDLSVNGETLSAEAGASLAETAALAQRSGLAGLAFASGIPGAVGGGTVMNAGAYGGELKDAITAVEGLRMDGTPFRYAGDEMGFGYRHSRLQDEGGIVTRVSFRLAPGDPKTIAAEMNELNERRRAKQPLDVPSAGSTFKRPEGHFAGALIEQCGLKGYAVGGARVSEKHAGFLVSTGGSAADFEALMDHVARVVLEETGIRLEPEIRILGEAPQ